ncbi:cysteine dioxygenase [Actinophytocola algeriensis]|uniref:Quercetin dioxygenase-like cupin family protein n=1 Tax=Actinophytocola algeriensis TaxID=1768010 RepID=A0A7W7Q756_9PSEU|nr:cysteine dioxygenase family protein [Actinophytocola algeriensis]MBB4908285.1 quercetin dioxygenase-like cupin family protein [Actinophytocola algeriensis]MBE1480315.1 quercetin dioxygenase-like cupin family protein [Actinophytocola algeriensis]
MFAVPANTIASSSVAPTVHPALVARAYAADRARWAHLLRYDPDERFAVLVEATDEQEIWLMSWLPGQETDHHDHGNATGAFTVVSGSLTEHVLHRGVALSLSAGQSRVFGPGYAHHVRNEGPDPAVTLHVYRGTRTNRAVFGGLAPLGASRT